MSSKVVNPFLLQLSLQQQQKLWGGPPFYEYFSKKYFFFKGWLPLVFGIYICEKLEYKMTPAYIGGREAVFQILMILRPASIY